MAAERIVYQSGAATADLESLADYLLGRAGRTAALGFVDSAERAFGLLLEMPRIGPPLGLDELPYRDFRRGPIEGFDKLIILYRELADGIEVARVLQTAPDIPGLLRNNSH